jgi:1,4-dihydroxy-2-naphthoyl-CoA hydrolase
MTSPIWEVPGFRQQFNAALQNSMLGTIGFVLQEMAAGRCVGAIDFSPALTQPQGLFHTGAILTLADSTASIAALTVTDPEGTLAPDKFPLAIQLSVNLVRNTNHGRITSESQVVHGGRTTQVVETQVTDDEGRLLAKVTTTHLVVSQ